MKLEELVLHPASAQQLEEFVAQPTHALLLAGPAGTGKTHVAAALAAQLLDTPLARLEHNAYYRQLVPIKGVITIEQIRELLRFFRLKVPGRRTIERVAMLADADTMGHEAQNALLKQLEEPPAGAVLILTSSRPGRLLPTIRS